ncbi:MAG: metallophosphoesterase [Phascolarctobacterium sp.]
MRNIFFIGMVDLLLSTLGYLYYRHQLPWGRSCWFALGYLTLTLNAMVSRALSPSLPHLLVKLSAWAEGLWVAFGYYTLLFALVHLALWLLGKILPFQLPFQLPSGKIALITLVASLLTVTFGSLNAFSPTVRTEVITTSKLPAGTSYKLALISDVHLGRILGRSYAEKLTQRLNDLQPDAVLIAGDLIDERIAYVKEDNSLAALAKLNAPKGVYLAFGNHEYKDNPALWQSMAEANGIKVLRDASTVIDGQLKITGLNDFRFSKGNGSKVLQALAWENDKYYSVLMDHQPRRMLAATQAGYDLYLSGHTHTGQLFPNRQITKRMYLLDYGRASFGQLTAITSAGYGFWGPPVRTEGAPEIVLIKVVGQSK